MIINNKNHNYNYFQVIYYEILPPKGEHPKRSERKAGPSHCRDGINCVKQEQPNISLGTVYRNSTSWWSRVPCGGSPHRSAVTGSGHPRGPPCPSALHLLRPGAGSGGHPDLRAGPKCHAHHRVPGQRPAAAAQRHLCGLPGCPAGASRKRLPDSALFEIFTENRRDFPNQLLTIHAGYGKMFLALSGYSAVW